MTSRSKPKGKPTRIGESDYLREMQRKLKDPQWVAEHTVTEAEAEAASAAKAAADGELPPNWIETRQTWPLDFEVRCYKAGLREYLAKLDAIMSGDLAQNEMFKSFRRQWMDLGRSWEGAIILGASGAGKSIAALWACYRASYAGVGWEFIDAAQISTMWARQEHDAFDRMRTCALLVIDEIGDCEDMRGNGFTQMKELINRRYKDQRTVILCTTQEETALKKAISDEIVDRFRIRVVARDRRSYRQRRGTGKGED